MPTDVEKLYSAVKSGQIHPSKLNDEGKKALKNYITAKQASETAPKTLQQANQAEPKTFLPAPMPRGSVSSRQRAETLAGAPGLVRPALGLVNKALDAYEQSPVGKFSERAGEAANNTRLMREDLVKTTTGNAKADWVAENVGGLLGYVGPGSGALYSSAGRVLTSGVAKTLPRAAGVLGAAGAGTGATRGIVKGEDTAGVAKEAATEGLLSAAGGALLHGAGKVVGKATAKLAENKAAKGREALGLVNEAYAGAKVEKAANNLKPKLQQAKPMPLKASTTPESPLGDTNTLPKLPKANTGANGWQEITPDGINPKELKDISGFQAYSTDVYRNFEKVYGDKFPEIKKQILDPLDASKKDYINFQQNWTDKLKTEVVDKLGISKGSKLSGLIQRHGEGGRKYFDKKKGETVLEPYTLDDLKRDAPNDWQKVVEADNWFRKAYDGLIDEVNAVRAQIYPNNPSKLIPKRQDYYRHFQELEGLGGIKNIFETPANIDPNLVAVSEFTQPKTKFLGFAQKRGLGPYKEDAVGGFLNYIPSASYAINIDKNIRNFAKLAGDLSKGTKDSRNLSNFINFLRKYSQDLAGKTNPIDRVVQEAIPGGRMTFNAVRWLNSRVKANVVLGNASSAIAQLANIPQGIAFAKQHSAEGLVRALKSIIPSADNPMNQSGFLAERYGGPGSSMYRQFDTKLIDQPKKLAAWVLETADKLGTNFVWNSAYSKAVREKIANPIKYADENTRKLVAGRGVGEIPLLQKSQLTQVIIPFTLEVANLWKVQKGFLKGKDFTGLAVLYVTNFLFNKAAEEVRGSGVVFDPIQAMLDAFPELKPLVGQETTSQEQDLSPLQRGGRLAGEGLSNLPTGQYLASAYPEFGTDVFGHELPTRKELFGRNDPTRFGTGIALAKGARDPLYKLLPSFGGGQLQKTLKGKESIDLGGVYNKDKTKLNYPVETDPTNITKGLLFGPGGFRETKGYYDNNRRPLSEKQTLQLQSGAAQGIDQKALYDQVLFQRALDGIKQKISDVQRDTKLSDEEKLKQINELMLQGQSLLQRKEGGK